MSCVHEFMGTSNGVQCKRCGLRLDHGGYKDFISSKPLEQDEPKKRGRKKKEEVASE